MCMCIQCRAGAIQANRSYGKVISPSLSNARRFAAENVTETKMKNPQIRIGDGGFHSKFGAQDWTRTSTPLRALRPEHSASTNFATWAISNSKSNSQKRLLHRS